ncbi:helix-turn-helix transcriptional regulator [Aliarcobacter butzleri]|uniref:helix-turn-helix transcriptional regulator n=1 Tax=Aliarcobacter butzleri TaxID=28197 RepID=UPI001EDA9577|nr:helix-turn-helix domain-containing protein [Aliarcobacter butzleri]MCG3685927.1 helix-turn-helix domain-containing protein [Aliarcobacter butzleri]
MVLDKLLKIEEVLEILNIPKTSFYRYVKNGIIPQPVKIGRSSRWKTSEIQNFINNK